MAFEHGSFYGQPSPVPLNELLNLLRAEMSDEFRDLDPTRMDFVSQWFTTSPATGYPFSGRFRQKHVYPFAAQKPDADVLMSNRPKMNNVVQKPMRDVVEWVLPHARIYGTFEFNGDEVAVLDAGGIVNAIDDWVSDGKEALQRELSRISYGDGSGCRGVVQASVAAGVSTIPLKRHDTDENRYAHAPGARYCWPNVPIEFRRGGVLRGSQKYMISDYPRVKVSDGVDHITIDPAIDAGGTLAEGDEIYFATDDVSTYNEEPGGLGLIYDDGLVHPTWKGVNRWSYQNWGLHSSSIHTTSVAEGNAGHMQKADDILLTVAIDHYHNVTGNTDITLVAHGNVWREFPWGGALRGSFPANAETPVLDQRFGAQKVSGVVQGGLKMYEYFHTTVNVKRVSDPWAEYGRIRGLVPSELMKKELQPFSPMDPVFPDSDKKKVRFVWRGNYDCRSDGRNGLRIDRISVRDDAVPIH